MRTNINIDDTLLHEAFKYAEVKSKKDLVALALKEFIENRKRRNIAELRGKIRFAKGYDYKKTRGDSR